MGFSEVASRIDKQFGEWFRTIWVEIFTCPKCKKKALDLSMPHLKHPVVCRGCYTLFDLKEVKKKADWKAQKEVIRNVRKEK